MTRNSFLGLVTGTFTLLAVSASDGRAQTSTTEAELPAPVAKTFRATFPKAEILKLDAEEENGVMIYDFEFKDGDVERETDIAGDGTMLEVTLVIDAAAVPAAAMKTVSANAKGAKIGRLERIEVSYEALEGKVAKLPAVLTRYAAEMSKGKKMAEVIVNPDGSVLEAPEWVAVDAKPAVKAGK